MAETEKLKKMPRGYREGLTKARAALQEAADQLAEAGQCAPTMKAVRAVALIRSSVITTMVAAQEMGAGKLPSTDHVPRETLTKGAACQRERWS